MDNKPNSVKVDGQEQVPSKIVCIGRNYVAHIEELGNPVPDDMVVFIKPNSAISNKLYSYHQEPLDYEAELSFVVKGGKFTAVGFGFDLTKRATQKKLKTKGLPWVRAKAFDGSAVFSDFVNLPEDYSDLTVELEINGQPVQSGQIKFMLYKPHEILAELSSFMNLLDGDIVMTGTPKGVGRINAGDRFVGRVRQGARVLVSEAWVACEQ